MMFPPATDSPCSCSRLVLRSWPTTSCDDVTTHQPDDVIMWSPNDVITHQPHDVIRWQTAAHDVTRRRLAAGVSCCFGHVRR